MWALNMLLNGLLMMTANLVFQFFFTRLGMCLRVLLLLPDHWCDIDWLIIFIKWGSRCNLGRDIVEHDWLLDIIVVAIANSVEGMLLMVLLTLLQAIPSAVLVINTASEDRLQVLLWGIACARANSLSNSLLLGLIIFNMASNYTATVAPSWFTLIWVILTEKASVVLSGVAIELRLFLLFVFDGEIVGYKLALDVFLLLNFWTIKFLVTWELLLDFTHPFHRRFNLSHILLKPNWVLVLTSSVIRNRPFDVSHPLDRWLDLFDWFLNFLNFLVGLGTMLTFWCLRLFLTRSDIT